MYRLKAFLFAALAACSLTTQAQPRELSLKDCIEMGLERNLMLKSKAEDVRLADVTRSDNRSRLLPMIQAFGALNDNLHRGTTVSEIVGVPNYSYVQGLQYVAQGGFQAQMPLYDQTLYIGLKIADRMKEISLSQLDKAREDLIVQIAQLYYLAQTTSQQLSLIDKNIRSLESLDSITNALRDNGVVLGVDAKRVGINLSNLRVSRDNAQSAYEQQLNLLRFVLDLAPEEQISVRHVAADGENDVWGGLSTSLPELQTLDLSLKLNEQQRRQVKASYLPTLSLVGNLSWTNFNDKFGNYFRQNTAEHMNRWYNTTAIGLQLSVPVFDRFIRRNNIRRIDINADKLRTVREATEKQLRTQYGNALNDWHNHRRNLTTRRDNYQLAQDVYDVTANQYREGVTSMTALLQDEMNMQNARTAYIGALYNYLVSRLTLLRLTGNLDELTM